MAEQPQSVASSNKKNYSMLILIVFLWVFIIISAIVAIYLYSSKQSIGKRASTANINPVPFNSPHVVSAVISYVFKNVTVRNIEAKSNGDYSYTLSGIGSDLTIRDVWFDRNTPIIVLDSSNGSTSASLRDLSNKSLQVRIQFDPKIKQWKTTRITSGRRSAPAASGSAATIFNNSIPRNTQ